MTSTTIPVRDGNGTRRGIAYEQETPGLSLHRAIAPGGDAASSANPLFMAGPVNSYAKVAQASFTRPANLTPYAAGLLVANATLPGSVSPLALPVARFNGGTGLITGARLAKSTTSLTRASFRVHLYHSSPVAAYGDGGIYQTSGAADYLGHFDLTMNAAFTDGAGGLYAASDQPMVFITDAGSSSIYALIEARDSYTPGSSETFTLALEVLQN